MKMAYDPLSRAPFARPIGILRLPSQFVLALFQPHEFRHLLHVMDDAGDGLLIISEDGGIEPAPCSLGALSWVRWRAMKPLTRRRLLTETGIATASVMALGAGAETAATRSMKILVTGGHPGDPEAGCGGTIARYAQAGHQVTCLYLTRGQAGVSGKTAEQAGTIRTAEGQEACRILKATALFAEQMDGATELTAARYGEFAKLVASAEPDVIFTQWPVDHHRDHRVCAALAFDAWIAGRNKVPLYYYEVDLGSDTQNFRPTHYVDVTAAEPLKRQACMAHQSQDPAGFYLKDHVPMLRFRGMECGRQFAEAFIHHDQSRDGGLPG